MTDRLGPGRPRLVEPRRQAGSAREEILDAAAELFTQNGYAGTTTRRIAKAVGIRQASLYHHFRTKEDILEALLDDTVMPTLRYISTLDQPADREAELAQLLDISRFDSTLLAEAEWNLGTLYLLPELNHEKFSKFRMARVQLAREYSQRAARVVGDAASPRIHMPFRLVESVINIRSDNTIDADFESHQRLVDAIVEAIEQLLTQ